MIPQLLIIALTLFSLSSCGADEAEEKKAERERIKIEYPLLGLGIPTLLIEDVVVVDGNCQEETNVNSFEIKNYGFQWSKSFNKETGEIKSRRPWMKIHFHDGPSDRYNRRVPPDWCRFDDDVDLSSSDYIKGSAICTRHVRGYNYEGEDVELAKKENAVCELRVVERLNCFPDRMFLEKKKPTNPGLSKWQKKYKHQACSAANFAEYRKQTLERWQEHKGKLQKTAVD